MNTVAIGQAAGLSEHGLAMQKWLIWMPPG